MRPPRLVLVCASLAMFLLTSCGAEVGALTSSTHPAGGAATVTLTPSTVTGTWSRASLGLSFEYSDLVDGHLTADPSLIRLMRNLGTGVLRIGGNSVDATATHGPSAAQLAQLARLLTATGWTALYAVDLGHFNAAEVSAEVRHVAAALGPRLAGFSCGNEPNDYRLHRIRPASYGAGQYLNEVVACYRVLRAQAPHVPVAGIDTGNRGWVTQFLTDRPAGFGLLTQHLYAGSNCGPRKTTTAQLLSSATADHTARLVAAEAALARSARVPLRLTEVNSIACGGGRGVSNTFAAALWASDFALTAADNGASGINLHQNGNDSTCVGYSAVCRPRRSGFRAAAPYYGLLFDAQLGWGSTIATTDQGNPDLGVHAVRHADGSISVLLVNRSGASIPVTVQGPRTTLTASTIVLRAAGGLGATTGITIQGRSVAADGSYAAAPATPIATGAGLTPVRVPAYSAIIVQLAAPAAGR